MNKDKFPACTYFYETKTSLKRIQKGAEWEVCWLNIYGQLPTATLKVFHIPCDLYKVNLRFVLLISFRWGEVRYWASLTPSSRSWHRSLRGILWRPETAEGSCFKLCLLRRTNRPQMLPRNRWVKRLSPNKGVVSSYSCRWRKRRSLIVSQWNCSVLRFTYTEKKTAESKKMSLIRYGQSKISP